jgi:hypothetical protein
MADEPDDELPRLSDVLGALVAGVAHARGIADSEVMSIARRYRRHEYLRGLSVPRLRVREVVVDLPVLLGGVVPSEKARIAGPETIALAVAAALAEATEDLGRYTAANRHKMRPGVAEQSTALVEELGRPEAQARFAAALRQRLRRQARELDKSAPGRVALADVVVRDEVGAAVERLLRDHLAQSLAERARREREAAAGPIAFGDDLGAPSKWTRAQEEEAITEAMLTEAITELVDAVRAAAEDAAILRGARPADFFVRVDTEEIKTAGTPGAVTRIQLTLTEEGLEWSEEGDGAGAPRWKLRPE